MDKSKITCMEEKRAEKLLREYVKIRHELTGTERIIAICTWSQSVDSLYSFGAISASTSAPQ